MNSKSGQTFSMTEFEYQVLKYFNGDKDHGITNWDAGLGVAMEFLQGEGFLTRSVSVWLTDKGRKALELERYRRDTAFEDSGTETV